MKDRILTNTMRSIRRAFPRFLSLLVMSMLGMFAFSGLQATAPDMRVTLDRYLDEYNVYDVRIVSDLGLSESDVVAFSALNGVEMAEGAYSKDYAIDIRDGETVLRVYSMPEQINRLELLDGRLPRDVNEVVVEANYLHDNGLALGNTVPLGTKEGFIFEEGVIVGTVDTALYINNTELSQERGTTTVGTGTVDYFAYALPECFDSDVYACVYLTVSGAEAEQTGTEKYCNLVESVLSELENVKEERQDARYRDIFDEANSEIDNKERELNEELADAKNELDVGKEELDEALAKLEDAEKLLSEANQQLSLICNNPEYSQNPFMAAVIEEKQAEYEKGLSEYNENKKLYGEKYADYLSALDEYEAAEAEGRGKIADARAELEELRHPTIYLFDRTDDSTYSDYLDDTDSVANLSKIFPAVFFAVAVLVSLISMNRMVEEERGEIGALKSLGFGNGRIIAKYIVFSFSATVVGGCAGAALGLTILPSMISGIYGILFDVPDFYLGLNLFSTIIGFLITVICVCGTSVFTAWKELRSKPSELLRPKAPKSGRRVLLERIGFIWKHMNFSQKVTVRNLFRYKKRVVVTVGGIAGCTALMLCGFGLRDSIMDIAKEQGDGIYLYDATVYVNEDEDGEPVKFEFDEISECYHTKMISGSVDDLAVSLFVAEDTESLSEINFMADVVTGEELIPETGKVIITEKMSAMTGYGTGDTIVITDADNKEYSFPVSGVAVNYVGHYVYVDAYTFESVGGEFSPNVYFLKIEKDADKDELTKKLLSDENVLSVSYKSDLMDNVKNMLNSLNSVVLILIVLAALLAFVVLYNLSNININERKREIATLKVLGFHDTEVDAYITKETVILTAFGIALGLIFGYFLTNAVVSTVEIESCRFIHHIKFLSYVFSAVLSALFTLIVNFVTHFKLRKIDMIESLKSVE